MATPEPPATRSAEEFTGDSGLIRRFLENGEIVDAIINDKHIYLLPENYVKTEEAFSIHSLFDKFKKIQDVDPNQAPLAVVATIDPLTPNDYERGRYNKEWCIPLLGKSIIDMYDRDQLE